MSLKKIFTALIVGLVVAAASCKQNATSSTFTISGHIKNPKEGKIILTQEEDINGKKKKFIKEIEVGDDGKFSVDFDLEPHIYTIDFYDDKKITLAVNRGQRIEIQGDANDLENLRITGSEDTKKLQEYESFRKESLQRLVKSVREKLKDSGKTNDPSSEEAGRAEVENYEKHKDELNDFVKTKMGNSIAVYATTLRWDGDKNIPLFESIAEAFSKKHGDIEIAKRVNEKVALLKATSVGGEAASIESRDRDGKAVKLMPAKAKITLVDFWASWCGPCRRESKTLGALYEKFKSRGFEIYGVSLDDDREKWQRAIEQDERTWTNVSSLKGFETSAAFDYAVTSLPAKFFIDSDGKIVAKNLSGKDLEEKLEALLAE